jgi:hypothetical protein
VVTGTWASCSVSGVSPPSEVAPQPTIVSIVPGAQAAASPAPATCVGAFEEALARRSSVMS